jgi:hypothetical protein
MASSNLEHLKAYILPLSLAMNFYVAHREWEVIALEISDEGDTDSNSTHSNRGNQNG